MLVKICGIMTAEAALAAKRHGADLIGFVFAASRRRIDVAGAAAIARQVSGVGKVGVFVGQPLAEVREIAERCRLDIVQLHGDEPAEYCQAVGRPVIKAIRAGSGLELAQLAAFPADWLLLDSYLPGQPGGTGVAFDWRQAQAAVAGLGRPFLVAGGLNADNVGEAIRVLRPAGVDVSGGVETDGVKDEEKIRRFVTAAKNKGEEAC
ncbi:MAG: phosphoribosylanthranilate isomerase [Negativicutes bacterium]|nr:phosphoribosylanthranilate isomerase [Negativicutes bacterium]